MKRKQLSKKFKKILNWKNPLVSMGYTPIFQRGES